MKALIYIMLFVILTMSVSAVVLSNTTITARTTDTSAIAEEPVTVGGTGSSSSSSFISCGGDTCGVGEVCQNNICVSLTIPQSDFKADVAHGAQGEEIISETPTPSIQTQEPECPECPMLVGTEYKWIDPNKYLVILIVLLSFYGAYLTFKAHYLYKEVEKMEAEKRGWVKQ